MIETMEKMSAYFLTALSEVAAWLVNEPVVLIFVGLGVLAFSFGMFRKMVN